MNTLDGDNSPGGIFFEDFSELNQLAPESYEIPQFDKG